MRKLLVSLAFCLVWPAGFAAAEPVAIAVPPAMSDSGFARHLLVRFKFRARIALEPVAPDAAAALAFRPADGKGEPLLVHRNGTVYHLVFAPGDETGEKLVKWLRSDPGRSAVAAFPKDGPPLFAVYDAPVEVEEQVIPEGDATLGSELALTHCGRCHVVDDRNRMGGIGSTPSFGALRARDNWAELFALFWGEPPHPTFTQIPGMTEAFTAARPARIAPVELDQHEVDAIIAFIATMKPKDLGAPLSFN